MRTREKKDANKTRTNQNSFVKMYGRFDKKEDAEDCAKKITALGEYDCVVLPFVKQEVPEKCKTDNEILEELLRKHKKENQ